MNRTAEKETEYGVKNAEEAVNADMGYINSEHFAGKFRNITSNERVNRTLLECSRRAIMHRSGTLYEDMYLINAVTGEIEGSQTESEAIQKISYNDSLRNAVAGARKNNIPLIALHTHPEGYPPSIDDFNSLCSHGYVLGVVVGHNGQVYTFRGSGTIIGNADDVQREIVFAYKGGIDVDRAHRDVYAMYGLEYDLKGGNC